MADASTAFLLNKIDNFVTNKLNLGGSLEERINELKSEHEVIREVLKGADALREQDSQTRVWIKQLRAAYHEIESIFGMYAYKKANESATPWYSRSPIMEIKENHDISEKIDGVLRKLINIKDKDKYGIPLSSHPASTSVDHQAGIATMYTSETKIVGVEGARGELAYWVLDLEKAYQVLFVVGMAGSGKTALVKLVYEQLKADFDCHVWLTASTFEKMESLLLSMYDKLSNQAGQSPSTSSHDLIGMLRNYLRDKRYLIVLDDWNRNDWESVKYALPEDNNSRVIITTRRGDIASLYRNTSVSIYRIPPLPFEKAQELFCREAFPGSGRYPSVPGLREASESLLMKCEGLPLVIVQIGKLLSRKEKRESVFKKLESTLTSTAIWLSDELEHELSSIQRVLLSGYHDLPYHLKCCFLYMSMFPEDQPVNRRMLIRLWIAEDFTKGGNQDELEEIGEEYLKELIQRNLVQVSELEFDGRPRTCRLHNFMHKIVLSKSKDESFCSVTGDISGKVQRLSIQERAHPEEPSTDKGGINMPDEVLPHIHTFVSLIFGMRIPPGIIPRMNLLKILHLDHATLEALPNGVKKLLLLKYLSLRNTRIKKLPISTGRLKLLETLNLKQTFVTELPDSLVNFENLQHLLVGHKSYIGHETFDAVQGVKVPKEIGKLTNLQNLSFVRADRDHKLIRGLRSLKKLRKLGIVDLPSGSGSFLCETIQMLTSLRSLSMKSEKDEILQIQEIDKPPQLRRLCLWGRLERMPTWIPMLHELVRIRLKWSRMAATYNPITILGKLNNLLELQLLDAYGGKRLDFCDGTFLKLKILEFNQMEQLLMITIGNGALPCLQKLSLILCRNLKGLPTGIANITQLKELHLRDMPRDYVNPLKRNGPLHHLVRNVKISSFHLENGEWVPQDMS